MSENIIKTELWFKFIENDLSAAEIAILKKSLESDNCDNLTELFDLIGEKPVHAGLIWAAESAQNALDKKYAPDEKERSIIFSNIMAHVDAPPKQRFVFHPKWLQAMTAISALAAILIMFFFIGIIPDPKRNQREKGTPIDQLSVTLSAAILKNNSDMPERAIRMQHYSQSDVLYFRYEISASSYIYFFRYDENNSIKPLNSSGPAETSIQPKGVYEFRINGTPQGFPLSELNGKQTFIIMATSRPVDIGKAQEYVLNKYLDNKSSKMSSEFALDAFEIFIEESEKE